MAFQNPNLVPDESLEHDKITHFDLTLDDQISVLFPQLHEIPWGYSVSSLQTDDSAAGCHQSLVETLKPIPFKPPKALDFKSHESLLGGMSSRISSMGMPSGSFIQEMEAAGKIPLSCGNGLSGNPEDFFTHTEYAQMFYGPSSSSGDGHKWYVDHDHNLYQSPTVGNKRQRSDSLWEDKPVDFNMCMENIQRLMGEARMMYAAKAQACEASSVNHQTLLDEKQDLDRMIKHLQKAHLEESQKRRQEVRRLERELYTMGKILEGYRKILKETQQAFNEYRIRCPQANEQAHNEVPGSGKGTRTNEASDD